MVTLYTTPLSANARKVMAVSRQLGLSPEIVDVDVYRGAGQEPSYLARNPLGKIPLLVEGDFVLSESNAILGYLAEAHGDGRLSTPSARGRADVARWMFWEATEWQPALRTLLAPYVGHYLRTRTLPPEIAVDWQDARFQKLAGVLDAHLARKERPFLVGDDLTVADFAVAGLMMYVRLARFPFDAFPAIGAWFEGIEATEGWRSTGAGPWA